VTAAEHPAWCDRSGCTARGWHGSARLLVHADGRTTGQNMAADQPAAAVRLVQLLADADPQITLTGGDLDDRAALLLTVRQARALRRFLARLVDQAEQQ
jgi:hypothetical protein